MSTGLEISSVESLQSPVLPDDEQHQRAVSGTAAEIYRKLTAYGHIDDTDQDFNLYRNAGAGDVND